MAASGSLAAHESQSRKPSMWVSDDPLTEAVFGGPIIGTGGRFLVMSLPIDDSDDFTGRNVLFLRGVIPLNRLRHFGILNPKKLDFRGYSLPTDVFCASPSGFRKPINRLKSFGYPMPPPLVLEFNGELLNIFEGYFGGLLALEGYPYDDAPFVWKNHVWEQLPKEVVSDISQRVVSLKSFCGHVSLVRGHDNEHYIDNLRCGASGVGGHDDDDHIKNLRIEVSLPQNRTVTGTLGWYNVDYNIAIVSVTNYICASRPENIFNAVQMPSRNALPTLGRRKLPTGVGKVVAIGRNTEQRLLMASVGEVKQINKGIKLDSIGEVKQRNKRIKLCEVKQRNKPDCRYLKLSTCKINKAGIGGPLINFGGSFVGMNFYDGSEGTPFLPRSRIVEVLKRVIIERSS